MKPASTQKQPVPPMRKTMSLFCTFAPEELLQIEKRMADVLTAQVRAEEQRALLDKELAQLRESARDLAAKRQARGELRMVDVTEEPDWRRKRVSIIRTDQQVVVATRPMTIADRQLFLVPPEEAGDPEAASPPVVGARARARTRGHRVASAAK